MQFASGSEASLDQLRNVIAKSIFLVFLRSGLFVAISEFGLCRLAPLLAKHAVAAVLVACGLGG